MRRIGKKAAKNLQLNYCTANNKVPKGSGVRAWDVMSGRELWTQRGNPRVFRAVSMLGFLSDKKSVALFDQSDIHPRRADGFTIFSGK